MQQTAAADEKHGRYSSYCGARRRTKNARALAGVSASPARKLYFLVSSASVMLLLLPLKLHLATNSATGQKHAHVNKTGLKYRNAKVYENKSFQVILFEI